MCAVTASARASWRSFHSGRVLGGEDQGLHFEGAAALVGHRDLGLGVGAQAGDQALPPGQRLAGHQAVRQHQGQGHQLRGLAGGVADHHPLVAGAQFAVAVHGAGDVGRLAAQVQADAGPFGVEAGFPGVVPGGGDGAAHQAAEGGALRLRRGADLAGEDHPVAAHQHLAGHPGLGVGGQHVVEHGIGDAVGHLVGVAHGDRF